LKKLKRLKPGVVPRPLRVAFVVHSLVDLVAIPLMVAPRPILAALGWQTVDSLATRLVAAALLGIGAESFLCRAAPAETYRTMLSLKIIWSTSAVVGLVVSMVGGSTGHPPVVWAIVTLFLGFDVLWVYWRRQIHAL
jgi:hypothetical protein